MGAVILTLLLLQEPSDVEKELEAFRRDYEKDRLTYFNAYTKAKGAEEKQRLREAHANAWLPRFKDLERRAKGTETGAGSLLGALNLGWDLDDGEAVRAAVEALGAGYIGSPILEEVSHYLQGGRVRGWSWCLGALRSLSDKATHPRAKAMLRLRLGCSLVKDRKSTTEEQAEGHRMLEAIRKEPFDAEMGRQAESELFEFDHLRVGCTPPDFEATDADGKTFKLSDYRGKVVLIEFWGFW